MPRIVVRDTTMRLPTIAKLFGAFGLAFTGFFTSSLAMPHLPVVLTGAGVLPLVAACFGIVVGWRVIGVHAGDGYWPAFRTGMRGAAFVAIWSLLYLGGAQMLRLAIWGQYGSVTEAVLDVAAKGGEFALAALHPEVLVMLLVGGALSGIFAEWGTKRWR